MTMAPPVGGASASFGTLMILAPPLACAGAGSALGVAASGVAPATTSGVETASAAGLRNGFSRSAIAAEAPTTASTASPAMTWPLPIRLFRAARGASACPSGRSISLSSAKPHPLVSTRPRFHARTHKPFPRIKLPEPVGSGSIALLRPCGQTSLAAEQAYWLFMTALSGFGGKVGSVFSPRSNCSA